MRDNTGRRDSTGHSTRAPARTGASAAPRKRVGRFEIVRALGSGAQGTVYLAEDTRLGRRVAVKTLHAGTGAQVAALLDEARIVGRIQHPNVVTLHDAGEDGGEPFLVFEYVEGEPLTAAIRAAGRLAPGRAVVLARQVLEGVAAAHAQGVIHRDLKPANVMLTAAGVARVTDFGIAVRSAAHSSRGGITGTPTYLAPECFDGGAFSPASDVFAAGMLLYEMLSGAPAATGQNVYETLFKLAQGGFAPPSTHNPEVDERLDAVVLRALARDPAERYASAEAMNAALAEWMRPRGDEPADEDAPHGTVAFLLRRMRHRSDFPALSATMAAVNRAVASERERSSVLCNAILKDFGVTNQLLKLVNSAFLSQFGGSISTVSRAVAIIGFEGVRNVALSLALMEHLQNKAQARDLADELAGSYLAALVARRLAGRAGVRESEEAYICGMLRRLGKLLVAFYLPEEAQAIARLAAGSALEEARAAREILGLPYEELGMAVAKSWHFPERIVSSMRPAEGVPRGPLGPELTLRAVGDVASALVDALRTADPAARRTAIARVAERHGTRLGLDAKALTELAAEAAKSLAQDAALRGLLPANSTLLSSAGVLAATAAPADDPAARAAEQDATVLETTRLDARPTQGPEEPAAAVRRQTLLAAGIQDITSTLAGEFRLNDVLRIILETMFRGIGFTRALLLVREAGANGLRARLGFGKDVEPLIARRFAIPLGGERDIFYAATHQSSDICIEDLTHERIRPYVPAWYREALDARGLVLFPIVVGKRVVALIYADADDPAVLRFRPDELHLLKTLRNQAVLAMRQKN